MMGLCSVILVALTAHSKTHKGILSFTSIIREIDFVKGKCNVLATLSVTV